MRQTSTVRVFAIALMFVVASTAFCAVWPEEREMENLQRSTASARFDGSPFAGWAILTSPLLQCPVLAYGPPVAVPTTDPVQLLNTVAVCAGTSAEFQFQDARRILQLTHLSFGEQRENLPVLGGRADIVLNARGEIMRWSLHAHDGWPIREHHLLDVQTAATALEGKLAPAKWKVVSGSRKAWFPDADLRSLRPVYWIKLAGTQPHEKWEGIVDASSGEILMDWPGLQTDVVSGQVRGPYWQPYNHSDVQIAPHPFETITVNGNSVTADTAGNFSRVVSAGTSNVFARMYGTYVEVHNGAGDDGQLALTLTAPYNPFVWEWTTNDATRPELNLYYHVNFVHGWYKILDPQFTGMDYPVPATGNYGHAYDNAFWDGWGMSFGSGAQYDNFAMYSDVIYHEYTHGVTQYVYGNHDLPYYGQPGAMNEAWSDYVSCTINGDPYEAEYIGGSFNSWFRNLESHYIFPQNWGNEVHFDSQFISAPLWTLRHELGAPKADSLMHFARYFYAATFLDYLQAVLETDDNDGDLSNGTPHGALIYQAFGDHGIGPGSDPHFALDSLRYFANGTGGSIGNGDRYYDQGETIELDFQLVNDAPLYPPPAHDVSIHVYANDNSLQITNGLQSVPQLEPRQRFTLLPIIIHINQSAADHWTAIYIDVTAAGTPVTLNDTIQLAVGRPHVLIVKDDPTSTVESYVTDALQTANKIYDQVDLDVQTDLADSVLPRPGMVIWLSGNAQGQILSAMDQYRLQTYLNQGNRVILSGQHLADALYNGPFATNVLHVHIVSDSLRSFSVMSTGLPFHDGEWFLISGSRGAGNQVQATTFEPFADSRTVAGYGRDGSMGSAGVEFGNGHGLIFGFGMEAISGMGNNSMSLPNFLNRLMEWGSDVLEAAGPHENPAQVTTWSLGPAYPNPFNANTLIDYAVPTGRTAELRFYDVLGRLVDQRAIAGGSGRVIWYPGGASGIYFVQAVWPNGESKPLRLLFLK
jgi:hypothetical protein